MTAIGLWLLGGAKRLWALLGTLNIWQLLCIALFASTAIFYVQRNNARAETESVRVDLNEVRAELERISTAKNTQRETTKQNVEKADKGDRKAREIADKIREAPIVQGKCSTPGLELLRNEI